MRIMQDGGGAYARPYACPADGGRDAHASIPCDLTALIDAHAHTHRAHACADTGRHTARAQTNANIERAYGHADAHTGGCRASGQCQHRCHG